MCPAAPHRWADAGRDRRSRRSVGAHGPASAAAIRSPRSNAPRGGGDEMNAHPSYLELDRFALGGGSSATRSHAENCPRCGVHLSPLAEPGHTLARATPARDVAGAALAGWVL